MGKAGEYTIKNEYQGGYSTLKPNYGESFTGYQTTAGSLGLTTDPRTANIIKDASTKLSSGIKHIELALVSKELFDSIPKQQLKEMNRLSKLTGMEVSIHGPVMDTSGVSQQGYSESQRESSERKIADVLERSHEVDPSGNVHVVFHSAEGIPGTKWKTLGKDSREAESLIVIDRDSGSSMRALEGETLYYPDLDKDLKPEIRKKLLQGQIKPNQIDGEKDYIKFDLNKGKLLTPENKLRSLNNSTWDTEIKRIEFERESAEKTLRGVNRKFMEPYLLISAGKLNPNQLTPEEIGEVKKIRFAAEHMEEASQHLNNSFSKAYKIAKETGNEQQMRALEKFSNNYKKLLNPDKNNPFISRDPQIQSNAVGNMVQELKEIIPEQFVDMETFATEKSSKTFGNAAFQAYKKYGEKAPVICIENPPAGFGLSTGEDLKNLVKASREQLAKNLIEKENKNKKDAEKIAEKLIGATWDVGHINMLRGQGFSDKEIIQETEKVAPYLKHVHLSDNFGFEHTELPMGMGNVPMKEIMAKLGQKGYDAKKIIEAGTWWQHFQTPPIKESLEGMGASFYTTGAAPTWNQSIGLYQGYHEGLVGQWLPQTNYETFGTGFSQLPQELGGDRQSGAGGRMGGGRM